VSVFLIQTNGREISDDAKEGYVDGAMGPTRHLLWLSIYEVSLSRLWRIETFPKNQK